MYVCPRCETTLSQSEVAEGYREVTDLSVIAKFELIDEPKTYLLAWTTTPWTLIGNAALAVGEDVKYIKISIRSGENRDESYILSLDSWEKNIASQFATGFTIEKNEILTKDLIGKKYKPLFDYYVKDDGLENRENGWQVVNGDFVTTEDGTGIVHIAPAFGEDDMNLGKKLNLPFIQHLSMDGIIKPEAGEFGGLNVKPKDDLSSTDVSIIKHLAKTGLLFSKEKYKHSYPHCWRCDTPLINYATDSWFVRVEKIKGRALDLAKDIYWFPKHIKEGRFGKWLEGARDWSISRQRFWATPIPIWRCSCGQILVVASRKELEKLSDVKITDLHKDRIDEIEFPCVKCHRKMKRIPDVLDCWFESGSMPYAELHYPFENQEKFSKTHPAEFIGEGVDQTRAWFYYLHLLSTAITDGPAFRKAIVNGIVLAEDGKKMSKKLRNYPDPMAMFDKYGADVVRFYLLSSPVVAAENLNFSEKELAEVHRGLFRMLYNSYYFFVVYARIDNFQPKSRTDFTPKNILDHWIFSELEELKLGIEKHLGKNYDLMRSVRLFPKFIGDLSNWYIRRSRKRFWKSEDDDDKAEAYKTLYQVLVELSLLMAPFTPFISEAIFKNLTGKDSVHLEDYPEINKNRIDTSLGVAMSQTRELIERGLKIRAENSLKVRQPLSSLYYLGDILPQGMDEIIKDELNVKDIKNVDKFPAGVVVDGKVALDLTISEQLKNEGEARELIHQIQQHRKLAGFQIEDRILIIIQENQALKKILKDFGTNICREVLAEKIDFEAEVKSDSSVKVFGQELQVILKRKNEKLS
jgi:isoleucyl-tRNA synthetase